PAALSTVSTRTSSTARTLSVHSRPSARSSRPERLSMGPYAPAPGVSPRARHPTHDRDPRLRDRVSGHFGGAGHGRADPAGADHGGRRGVRSAGHLDPVDLPAGSYPLAAAGGGGHRPGPGGGSDRARAALAPAPARGRDDPGGLGRRPDRAGVLEHRRDR